MKPTFRTPVLLILIGIFLVTNAVPEIMLYVVLFTFGLGFPLLFVNTVLLYLLAALPTIVFLDQKPRRWGAVMMAACLIPLVAFGIPKTTEIFAETKMQALLATDVSGRFDEVPKSIELVGYGGFWNSKPDDVKSAPCDALCQRLLLSRQVDLVRVTRSASQNPARRRQFDYVIEHRDTCPNAFGQGEALLPETKDAVASGTCFVAKPVGAAPVGARVVIQKNGTAQPKNLLDDIKAAEGAVRETQRLELLAPDGAGWSLRLRQTQVKYTRWSAPLHIVFAKCYGLCIGKPVFGRTERTLNAFDPTELTLKTFGVGEPAVERKLSPAGRVVAMLDHSGEELTQNQKDMIRDWAMSAPCSAKGCPPITNEDEAIAVRLVKDRRVTDFTFIGNVIGRNRHLVSDNMDLFLGEMEARGANSQFSNTIGAVLARLDIAHIRPQRDRMLALIEANEWKWSRGMGIMAGRLGVDTVPLIAERLGPKVSSETAALAACLADDDIGKRLVPHLLDYLRAMPVTDGFPKQAPRTAVKALARFGHFDEAKELYLARFPKMGEHSLPRQSAADVPKDINACYRG
jgi:hypothetical protein